MLNPTISPIPRGWSFNPSARSHRLRLLPFAGSAFLVVSYLAMCQLGVLSTAFDPIFGTGTDRVLHSTISRALPVPDAVLGALAYLLEMVLLIIGGDDRWLTRPWLAALSSLTAMSLAMASAGLLFMQPVLVHAWCTGCLLVFCLATILAQRSVTELLACLQSMTLLSHEKQNPWHWLWHGSGHNRDSDILAPPLATGTKPFPWTEGTHCVWTLLVSACLGAILLALPEVFSVEGPGRVTIELCGTLILSGSLLSMSEPLRPLRWLNGALGALLLFWFLGEPTGPSRWIVGALGLALPALCLYRGKIDGTYGLFSQPDELLRRLPRGPAASPAKYGSRA